MSELRFIKTKSEASDSYVNLAHVVHINFQPKQPDAQARLEFVMVDHITQTVFGTQAETLWEKLERMVGAP